MKLIYRSTITSVLAAALVMINSNVRAADQAARKPALSIEEADSDYSVQGEYAGELEAGDRSLKLGVQVIALGEGKFRTVTYHGGLPGAGWDGSDRIEVEAAMKDGSLSFKNDHASAVLEGGSITVTANDGTKLGALSRTVRKSPTLNAKPPEGSVVLFSGADSVDNWKNGKVTEEGLLQQGTMSNQTFEGGTLHVEFMLSYMPYARGQGRSNSGCYVQGRYEVQVLDSFGLSGEHNECGGVYSVKKPDVNMCLPPLQWQTYDIKFTPASFDADGKKTSNARMTVHHNGVLIHDDIEVPKSTTASPLKEGAEPGPVYLQNHSNPVRYRNIWFAKTAD